MTAHLIEARLPRSGFSLDVSLAWDERVAVVFGPSGAGKSTLFQLLLGFHPTAELRVRIGGVDLDDPARGLRTAVEARALGWVPQDPLLFPHLRVEENLRFGGARAEAFHDLLGAAIEVLELSPLLQRKVHELSGGERQRVAIGRALASGPRALLLDEPLASLDLALRARVLPYLLRIRDELSVPLLYITHEPDEAMLVGERVFVLDEGRVVASGDPRAVLWSRAVLPLSAALGMENVLEGRIVARAADLQLLETAQGLHLTLPPRGLELGERLRIGLRAEDVLLAADPPGRISARNVFLARVTRLDETSDGVWVHLDAGEPLVAKLTPRAVRALDLGEGADVHAVIKSQALRRLA
jgi:molybdate transport system ATP-binding protein